MIEVTIPGRGEFRFEHLLLDLNGTIALDGKIIEGVAQRIESLRELLDIILITADTHGRAYELSQSLGIKIHKIDSGDEREKKLNLVQKLGRNSVVAIGNGSNDAYMLNTAMLGICVIGQEGASSYAVANCDLVMTDINAALDLLLKPQRLIATLRK